VLALGLAAVSLAWPWAVPAQAATAGTTQWDTAHWDDAGSAAIRPPSTAVTLTFDDGDADEMTAARVLRQHGLAATFYIITGAVGPWG